MSDPSREHQRPEAEALADARIQLQRAASAMRAAAAVAPQLTQFLGDIHAQVIDIAELIREAQR